jgi:AAHS family 4-hydroxybenzoate transporter-like MFS transporter
MANAEAAHVGEIIEGQKFGRFQAGLMFWICAFMFIEGYDMQVLGYAAPAIIEAWHSSKSEFGILFGAGLGGFMFGATILGNLGDKLGRKRMIIAGALLFGLFTLACAFAEGLNELLVFRVIAGVGLGGLIPNAIALMAEYAPARVRATRVGIMFVGYTAGSALGGFIAAQLIPAYGWPSVFIVGGAVPIILATASIFTLPESVRFLMLKRGRSDIVLALLQRARPELNLQPGTAIIIDEAQESGLPVTQLFTGGRAAMTALLWLGFSANMVTLHFLTSWLPTIATDSGVPLAHAVIATALLQAGGGAGSLVVGFLLDRIGTRALVVAFLIAAPCVASLGRIGSGETLLMLLAAASGLCIVGAQAGINALAGTLYPTSMRSTGTGWAFGVGRIGSILGPVAGGQLLALGFPHNTIFAVAAAPILISATALFFLGRLPIVRDRAPGVDGQPASFVAAKASAVPLGFTETQR